MAADEAGTAGNQDGLGVVLAGKAFVGHMRCLSLVYRHKSDTTSGCKRRAVRAGIQQRRGSVNYCFMACLRDVRQRKARWVLAHRASDCRCVSFPCSVPSMDCWALGVRYILGQCSLKSPQVLCLPASVVRTGIKIFAKQRQSRPSKKGFRLNGKGGVL